MFEAEGFVAQGLSNEDLPLLPGKDADLGDAPELEVTGVDRVGQILWVRPC